MSKPPSNARELPPVFVELLREPAYKALRTEICCECKTQHVTAEGETICDHQVARHLDGREKKICRLCWMQAKIRAKYTAFSSPWTAAEWVEKI